MAPDNQSIDGLLQQITSSNNLEALAHTLRTIPAGSGKDVRDFILASPLSSGQDPLSVLDLQNNTLGVIYILSARLFLPPNVNSGIPRPSWAQLTQFCQTFIPEQARLAPDRMVMLAKGIVKFAGEQENLKQAIPLLYALATRLPYTPSTLTPIHPILLLTALQSRHIAPEIPRLLLDHPIDDIFMYTSTSPDLSLSPTDNMTYHYLGGIILALTEHYTTALDYFEATITAPATGSSPPAALQLEALKKLRIIQCIAFGGAQTLPKYTSSLLLRVFKSTPYYQLINAFPGSLSSPNSKDKGEGSSNASGSVTRKLEQLVLKEKALYASECNLGLIERMVKEAPKWIVKKLTETYVTLGLTEIGKHIGLEDEAAVRSLVLSMIESKTILASISASGIVTFHDTPGTGDVSPEDLRALLGASKVGTEQKFSLPALLASIQAQSAHLAQLDMELGRSKGFVSKAVKLSGGTGPGSSTLAGTGLPAGPFGEEEEVFHSTGGYEREDSMIFG